LRRWYKTTARYRRGKRLRKLPTGFAIDLKLQPLAVIKVTFIRQATAEGDIDRLEQAFISASGTIFSMSVRSRYVWPKIVYQTLDASNLLFRKSRKMRDELEAVRNYLEIDKPA
jgi:hypothetical protein